MTVTAWNNGKHHESGAGYGFKVDTADRDEFFEREWKFVILELEGSSNPVKVNVDKPSFWGPKCSELINKEIGKWLREKRLAPWPKYEPPKFSMEPISENRFLVSDLSTVSE